MDYLFPLCLLLKPPLSKQVMYCVFCMLFKVQMCHPSLRCWFLQFIDYFLVRVQFHGNSMKQSFNIPPSYGTHPESKVKGKILLALSWMTGGLKNFRSLCHQMWRWEGYFWIAPVHSLSKSKSKRNSFLTVRIQDCNRDGVCPWARHCSVRLRLFFNT